MLKDLLLFQMILKSSIINNAKSHAEETLGKQCVDYILLGLHNANIINFSFDGHDYLCTNDNQENLRPNNGPIFYLDDKDDKGMSFISE